MRRNSKWITLFFVSVLLFITLFFRYLDFNASKHFDKAFLSQDTYRLFSNDGLISFLLVHIDPITSLIQRFENTTSAPPIVIS
jgi:hypothetical protein